MEMKVKIKNFVINVHILWNIDRKLCKLYPWSSSPSADLVKQIIIKQKLRRRIKHLLTFILSP